MHREPGYNRFFVLLAVFVFEVVLNASAMSDYYAEDYLPNLVQGLIIPVKGELESLSMDGRYVSKKLLGEFGRGAAAAIGWAVFEPNGDALWANVRRTIEDFLLNEWQSGALLGEKPEKAFFVRCDRSTMTQNDLDNGRPDAPGVMLATDSGSDGAATTAAASTAPSTCSTARRPT